MLALVLGTLLAVGALAYVLYPLFAGAMPTPRSVVATAYPKGWPSPSG